MEEPIGVLINGYGGEDAESIRSLLADCLGTEVIVISGSGKGEMRIIDILERGPEPCFADEPDKILMFLGFSEEQTEAALEGFPRDSVPKRPIFCTLTRENSQWPLTQLIEHLKEEHRQWRRKENLSMPEGAQKPEELDQEALARLVIDYFHRTIVHHTLWFAEVERQMGMAKALEVMGAAWEKSYTLQMKRLAEVFGFELEKGVPKALLEMPREKLQALLSDLGRNWLAQDGIWFQTVEARDGIWEAKRCNDSCWVRFSPFEAWSIRRFLGLSEAPGLAGLKRALGFRLYAGINVQSTVEEGQDALIFRMNNCRVQAARKQRGLPDYPCKSAGLVEYRTFAETIDPRIRTECIACPPDEHPDEWFCAWRFTLKGAK